MLREDVFCNLQINAVLRKNERRREKLNILGFDENVKNTLVFFLKPRTVLYFLLKWNSGSKPQNRYEALRRYLTPQRYGLLRSAPAPHRAATIAPLLAAIDYYACKFKNYCF